ncbi:MAG TPA: DNA methyltransferase [Clostridiales bacterium]|nr:MAG: DNA methyltransferase [Clostridiales bacterium GWD2_32_59]HAN10110.1 DNA methyltransferase [Clostridiales bacterium]
MEYNNSYSTSYILDKFDISRQTLYNWINAGLVMEPERDWRDWRVWTQQTLDEIENVITMKKDGVKADDTGIEKNLHINNRRYLGSKHKMVDFIKETIDNEFPKYKSFCDLFAGTGVVANAFNKKGVKVIVNDLLHSNYLSYMTWFYDGMYNSGKVNKLIDDFNNIVPSNDNYLSINFGNKYFSMENARKAGTIREHIDMISDELTTKEKAMLITSLLYALDKVANTCGHYDAYRKSAPENQKLKLLYPSIKDSENKDNEVYKEDANKLVKSIKADVMYIDTPYNSRQYADAYHLLENIAEWKKPELEGVSMKYKNRSKIKSDYCTIKAPLAFSNLIENVDAKLIVVSYNNMAQKGNGRSNAKMSDEEIIEALSRKGTVKTYETKHQYFTTGKATIEDHKERLFVCKCK